MSSGTPPARAFPAERSIARFVAIVAAVLGVLGVAAGMSAAFARVPAALRYASLGAGVIELGVCGGLFRRRRAPWAFALSLEGTMTLMNILGLAEASRAPHAWMVVGLMLGRALLFALLVVSSGAFRGKL